MLFNKKRIVFLTFVLLVPFLSTAQEDVTIPPNALANLARPSVVRIVNKVEGRATIPLLKFNRETGRAELFEDKATTILFEEFLVGSGVIVNPDGYIITSSYLEGETIIKEILSASSIKKVTTLEGDTEKDSLLEILSPSTISFLTENLEILDFTFSMVVLDINSQAGSIEELFENGYQVTIISDLGDLEKPLLIKIDKTSLPSLPLASGPVLKQYTFNFTDTDPQSKKSLFQAGFAEGTLVSAASVGGPVINERGEISGILGYSQDSSGQGKIFTTSEVRNILNKHAVTNILGGYGINFKEGIEFLQKRECGDALRSFSSAEAASGISVDQYLGEYRATCSELIEKGKSLDSIFDKIRDKVYFLGPFVWPMLIALGVLVFLIARTASNILRNKKFGEISK